MTRLVKCVLCYHEDLGSSSITHGTQLSVAESHPWNLSAWEAGTGQSPWPGIDISVLLSQAAGVLLV